MSEDLFRHQNTSWRLCSFRPVKKKQARRWKENLKSGSTRAGWLLCAGLTQSSLFTCVRAVGEKQSGVEMQGRQKSRAAGLGDGTQCWRRGHKMGPKHVKFVPISCFFFVWCEEQLRRRCFFSHQSKDKVCFHTVVSLLSHNVGFSTRRVKHAVCTFCLSHKHLMFLLVSSY